MAGNIHPNIRPGGLNQRELVDALGMIVRSINGIAAKLDSDGGVTDVDYEANAYTAIIKNIITDSKGNRTGTVGNNIIDPIGVGDKALNDSMYQITDAFETLTEQLDSDGGITATTFEANCYTAKFLHIIENQQGNSLGNGTAYYFKPSGMDEHKQLVEWLWNAFDAIETLTEQLDADGDVTDTNYEALWFTAICTLMIENSVGSVIGVSR